MNKFFQLSARKTSVKQELYAGFIGYITLIYVMTINGQIMHQAGMSLTAALIATLLTTAISCILLGVVGNVPLLIAPAMGLNAVFAFDLVGSVGLTLKEAFTAVFVSGGLMLLFSLTPIIRILDKAISANFKYAIRAGIGLYLVLLGLKIGKVVVTSQRSFLSLNKLTNPYLTLTLVTLMIGIVLNIKRVKGTYLWIIVIGSILAYITGNVHYHPIKFQATTGWLLTGNGLTKVSFWLSVFSLLLILIFESLGTIPAQLDDIQEDTPTQFDTVTRVVGVTNMIAGVIGTSSTIAAIESESDIDSGGRTGLTSVFTGSMFLLTIAVVSILTLVPNSATAPVLILIGLNMFQTIQELDVTEDTPSIFSALLIVVAIPFTYSISNGMAIGFISYPIIKILLGQGKKVSWAMYLIGFLFALLFAIKAVLQ